jgi:hypothetical protein
LEWRFATLGTHGEEHAYIQSQIYEYLTDLIWLTIYTIVFQQKVNLNFQATSKLLVIFKDFQASKVSKPAR